jgi:VCBS repeat-containing protein
VLGNDSDPDGDALSASVQVQPQHGTLSLAGNGGFTYSPATDYSGPDAFEYRIDDGMGGQDQATVTLTVHPVNDAPRAEDDSYETPFETELSVSAPGVLDNDSDVEDDPLGASLVQGALHGVVNLAADGSFTYTPDPGFVGYDEFRYVATDASETSTTATVTLAVGIRKFTARADATVRANQRAKNFGDDSTLLVKEGPKPQHSYVQFQLDALEKVLFAKLRLHAEGSADPVELYQVDNTYLGSDEAWLEHGITWENAPPIQGTPLGTWDAVDSDGWVELDVTPCLEADGVYSFGLRTNSNSSITYSSREGDDPPVLLVASVPLRPKSELLEEFTEARIRKLGDPSHRDAFVGIYPLARGDVFRLDYEVATTARVRALLFDARGRRTRHLADVVQPPGRHSLHWDGRSDSGNHAGRGIYFLKLQIGTRIWTQKIVKER